jgi:hypothetical protein
MITRTDPLRPYLIEMNCAQRSSHEAFTEEEVVTIRQKTVAAIMADPSRRDYLRSKYVALRGAVSAKTPMVGSHGATPSPSVPDAPVVEEVDPPTTYATNTTAHDAIIVITPVKEFSAPYIDTHLYEKRVVADPSSSYSDYLSMTIKPVGGFRHSK